MLNRRSSLFSAMSERASDEIRGNFQRERLLGDEIRQPRAATLSLEPPAPASNNVKPGMRSAAVMPPSESPFFQVWNATDKRVECPDRKFQMLRVLSAPAERTLGIRSFFGVLLIIIRLGKVNSFLFLFLRYFTQFLEGGQ